MDDSIDSGNFSVYGYLPLIRKDSTTHMHGLAVYAKEGLPFASLENSIDSYLRFSLALLHSVPYFFFLCQQPSSSLCTDFDSISSNIDEVLSTNPYVNNVLVFGDFNVHHKDWLTYSGGTDRPSELCYNFLSQMTSLRWLTFLLRSVAVTLTAQLSWIYFFLLMLVFVLQWLSLHCEILIMLLCQFPLTFHQTQNGIPNFIRELKAILILNSVSGFRFKLMYISLIISIRSSLTHLHGFQLLVLLP